MVGTPGGLFADEPYVALRESRFHDVESATGERYFIHKADTGLVVFVQCTQACSDSELSHLIEMAGLAVHSGYASLIGETGEDDDELFRILLEPETGTS